MQVAYVVLLVSWLYVSQAVLYFKHTDPFSSPLCLSARQSVHILACQLSLAQIQSSS